MQLRPQWRSNDRRRQKEKAFTEACILHYKSFTTVVRRPDDWFSTSGLECLSSMLAAGIISVREQVDHGVCGLLCEELSLQVCLGVVKRDRKLLHGQRPR